jgi:hypothetical protein
MCVIGSSLKSFNPLWNQKPFTPLKGLFYQNISRAAFNLHFYLFKATFIFFIKGKQCRNLSQVTFSKNLDI